MREEEDCLYWPVKYSSSEAGAGGEVRQEMERSPQRNEHHSSGDTREQGKNNADQGGRKHRRERNIFIVWELDVKIPHMTDENSPTQQRRRFYDISFRRQQLKWDGD